MFKIKPAFQFSKKAEAAKLERQAFGSKPGVNGPMDPGTAPTADFIQSTYGNRATLRFCDAYQSANACKLSRPEEPIERQAQIKADEVLRSPPNEFEAHQPTLNDNQKRFSKPAFPDGAGTIRNPGALGSGGEPLPQRVRDFFEPRFGQDFSQVRLHRDAPANRMAEVLNARALTCGQHLVFGRNQWSPETGRGRHLLAHELAHVVQQTGPDPLPPGTLQREEDDGKGSSLGSTLTSAAATAVLAGLGSPTRTLASTVYYDPANYDQSYQIYLQIAIMRLEDAARRARERGSTFFGRAVTGKCLPVKDTPLKLLPSFAKMRWLPIVTHKAFYARYWSFEVNCDAGTANLFQIRGKPSEAIDEMFDNLHLWTFDCAEYLQVAQWYAQRHTLGAEAFDKKMTGLGGLTLRPHGSTGIMTKEIYIRKTPYSMFYRQNNVTMQTEPSDKMDFQLLIEAPIGTRVTWTNAAAPTASDPAGRWWSFGNENTIKTGDDQFAAHPFGTLSQAEIECRLAARGYVKEMEEAGRSSLVSRAALLRTLVAECRAGRPRIEIHKYILDKIYISRIEFFKTD